MMQQINSLLSTKFMTANVGPMLSSVLKVLRLSSPWLKAMIARAWKSDRCEEEVNCIQNSIISDIWYRAINRNKHLPETLQSKRSTYGESFDISEEKSDAQQMNSYQSVMYKEQKESFKFHKPFIRFNIQQCVFRKMNILWTITN